MFALGFSKGKRQVKDMPGNQDSNVVAYDAINQCQMFKTAQF